MKNEFVPFEKMSKKQQRMLNLLKRSNRGECNPTTRVAETPKSKYKRTECAYSDFSPFIFTQIMNQKSFAITLTIKKSYGILIKEAQYKNFVV
jgi:hypothetical protein